MSVLGRKKQLFIYISYVTIWSIVVGIVFSVSVNALQSANYQLIEPLVGGIGSTGSSSASFQSRSAGATIGVGTSSDSTSQVEAGHVTTPNPALAFGIINDNVNFSTFSPTTTSTATSSFEVSDYTSFGYIVQIFGTPPTNGATTITPLSSNAIPQVGINQYGINLVANNEPITFGANPNFGQFGFGSIAANYNIPNSYRFDSGDEIAYSAKSSGLTLYTISYIVNVSSLDPGGQYVATQNIVCTATY